MGTLLRGVVSQVLVMYNSDRDLKNSVSPMTCSADRFDYHVMPRYSINEILMVLRTLSNIYFNRYSSVLH